MKITIGIVKSRKEYFNKAIESAKSQYCEADIDIIVIDNLDKSKTIGKCFNEIAEQSNSDWIMYLGDDDYIVSEYLQSLISAYNNIKTDLAIVNLISYTTLFSGKIRKQTNNSPTGMWLRSYVIENPFDEEIECLVDTEMFNRLADSDKYFPAVAAHQYGYFYRQHDSNVSGSKLILNKLEREKSAKYMLSVGLPLYKSKDIAWVALESLCNQKGIDFEWELLIIEEEFESFGRENILKYKDRLKKVGCSRIEYIPIRDKISLSLKWLRLGKMADSKYFLIQDADCYSQPYRLKETKELFEVADADWVQSPKGAFYDVNKDNWSLFNFKNYKGAFPTALNMATRTVYLKKLPNININKGLNKWMYESIYEQGMRVILNESDNWRLGVDIHGKNTISMERGDLMKNFEVPFEKLDDRINLPEYIKTRLKEL